MSDDLKPKIQEHYDEISPYYHDLWGRYSVISMLSLRLDII